MGIINLIQNQCQSPEKNYYIWLDSANSARGLMKWLIMWLNLAKPATKSSPLKKETSFPSPSKTLSEPAEPPGESSHSSKGRKTKGVSDKRRKSETVQTRY